MSRVAKHTSRVAVLSIALGLWPLLAFRHVNADDPPAQPEPPVRLKKKARPPDEVPEKKADAKPDEKAKTPEPGKKPPQPPAPKIGDADPDVPDEPDADPREILGRASRNMRDAEDRLGKRDPGTATQQKQRDVVADLDKLIQQAQQQQQQQSSSSNSSQQQRMRRQQQDQRNARQQQEQQRQQQQSQDQAAQNNANQPGAGGRSNGTSKIADLYKDIWGHLPETMRQEMDAYSREQFMAKYNDLLKQYYSTLAEKSRRPGD